MSGKLPIDRLRDAAITLQIEGDDDNSAVKALLSTGDRLYVIKGSSVFEVQLADDIDPKRTNPNIPNLSQRVLTAGHDNEIVARILLTAKYLFDEHNATVKPFVASLLEACIHLARQVLELDEMARDLLDEIRDKEMAFAGKPPAPNAFCLPSISDIDSKVHHFLVKADKAKDAVLALYRLRFLPDAKGKPKLTDLDKAVTSTMQAEAELVAAWKESNKYFWLVRNTRNASEHPAENYRVAVSDFKMWPDGKVYPPLMEIQHPITPIRRVPVTEFFQFVREEMLAHSELALVLIRFAVLMDANPFNESVAELPAKERRHKHVRYYRVVHFNGALQILG